MTLALAWKEYRAQRTIWLLMALFALAALYGLISLLAARANIDSGIGWLAAATALAFPTTYGLVCGSLMLAGENEERTLWFLDYHAGGRFSCWLNKLGAGVVLTAFYSLLVGAVTFFLGLVPGPESPTLWLWLAPLVGLEAFLWGLLGSALSRTGITAIVRSALLLALPWLLTLPDTWVPRQGIVAWRLVLALGAVAASGIIFCRNDWQRSWRWHKTAATLLSQPRWWALPWLVARQGTKLFLTLAAISVVAGLAVPTQRAVVWPAITLLIGVACGTAVFSGESAGAARFLGDRRIPPWRVWCVKNLLWLTMAIALTGMVVVGAWFQISWEVFQRPGRSLTVHSNYYWWNALGRGDHLIGLNYFVGLDLGQHSSGQWWSFQFTWLLTGFAVGQFCAIIFRKGAIAAIVAGLSSIVVSALWAPSLVDRGLNLWWVVGFAGFLVAGTFLVLRAWAAGRLATRWPAGVLAGSSLLAGICIAGHIWLRASELPDIGEPFDVQAFEQTMDSRPALARGTLLQAAAAQMTLHEKEVTRRLGAPSSPLVLRDGTEIPADYREQLAEVLKHRAWPEGQTELERWLKEMLQGKWAGEVEKLARSELGTLLSPRQLQLYNMAQPGQMIQGAIQLFQARAIQEQQRRAHAAALDDSETLLGISRQLWHFGSIPQATASLRSDTVTWALLDKWLETLGPQTGLLQRALKILHQHEGGLDPPASTVKVDYLAARNAFQSWEIPAGWDDSWLSDVQKNLIIVSRMAPWEKEYVRHLLDIVYERDLSWVQRPYWEKPPAPKVRVPVLDSPDRHARVQPPQFFRARLDHRKLFLDATENLCRLRALRLQIALALYQVQEKKPATKLADLVPKYLPELPTDPFSGRPFGYRISPGEETRSAGRDEILRVSPGQGLVWSVGPDAWTMAARTLDAPGASWMSMAPRFFRGMRCSWCPGDGRKGVNRQWRRPFCKREPHSNRRVLCKRRP
jgi:hypothetical protein